MYPSINLLVCWLVNRLVGWLVDLFPKGKVARKLVIQSKPFVHRTVGWLVGWSVGWLVVCLLFDWVYLFIVSSVE